MKTPEPSPELADVFRLYGQTYRQKNNPPLEHLQVMWLIEHCRTEALGEHIERCDNCGFERLAFNSCRNRHCPKCQRIPKERWLLARKRELLPVPYLHNVFTLPHELNPLVLVNKTVCFNILFGSVAETLQQFAHDPKWKLKGQLGFITVLHTWTQQLLDHFHLHCIIPAGVLSLDHKRWIPSPSPNQDFLFRVECLSQVFKNKFLADLKQAYKAGKLSFPGRTANLAKPANFYALLRPLYQKNWNVYSKKPFAGPEQLLDYLGRYTHRVAISNNRILSVKNSQITFSWRDRSDGDKLKTLSLPANEFIRRFLLHVLPNGFMRIRHFGFLANKVKGSALPVIRQSFGLSPELPKKVHKSVREMMLQLTGVDINLCPRCRKGLMIEVSEHISPRHFNRPKCRSP